MRRPGSEDPHRRMRKFYLMETITGAGATAGGGLTAAGYAPPNRGHKSQTLVNKGISKNDGPNDLNQTETVKRL